MNNNSFNNIEKMISTSRLTSYRNSTNYVNGVCNIPKNNKDLIANYVLNAKLSENFYFLLQNLEVSLRNAIYDNFNSHFVGQDFFFLNNLRTSNPNNYDISLEFHSFSCWRMIGAVKYQFHRNRVPVTHGKIISELNFGFWTTLLEENYYTPLIWRQIFKDVFPSFSHGPNIDHDVPIISDKINKIRKFRNRIFHYEPIFNHPDLLTIRDDILEAIGWINADMQKLSKMYDESESIILERKEIRKALNKFNYRNRTASIKKLVKQRYKNK